MIATPVSLGAKSPATWDGLVQVQAKKLDAVFLTPDADFRIYSKIMLDKPEIAFHKNWKRDYNRSSRAMPRITDEEVRRAIDEASDRFDASLRKAFAKAGYQLVDQPGPDVMRVATGVLDVLVTAPERMTAGRSRTYANTAGEGTLVVEARDSLTGALLGRALDRRIAGDDSAYLSNAVSNRADFDLLFEKWSRISAEGLGKLKAASPIDTSGNLRK
jgi:hypothetical protein